MGPDRKTHLRNIAIIVLLAVAVWQVPGGDRSVDVFVRKLRQKLEVASPEWRYIHTHFGIGYRFDAEPAEGVELPAVVPAVPEPAAAEPAVREHLHA